MEQTPNEADWWFVKLFILCVFLAVVLGWLIGQGVQSGALGDEMRANGTTGMLSMDEGRTSFRRVDVYADTGQPVADHRSAFARCRADLEIPEPGRWRSCVLMHNLDGFWLTPTVAWTWTKQEAARQMKKVD